MPEDLKEKAKTEEEAKKKAEKKQEDEIKSLRTKLIACCKQKIADGVAQEAVYQAIRDVNGGNANPNSIKDAEVLTALIERIAKMEAEKKE